MIDEPTIPCAICGEPTSYTGTERCNNCWEVEGRLDKFVLTDKGKAAVLNALVAEIEMSRRPSRLEVGNAIKALNDKAYGVSMNGGDDSDIMAVIYAIQWAFGAPTNIGDGWVPHWIKKMLDDITV